MIHSVFHAIGVFFDHLASVEWKWLALGVAATFASSSRSRARGGTSSRPRTPTGKCRWRQMFGAYVAGTGVNAIIPARGGDVVRLYLAKHRIEGSTYTTLVSTSLLQTLFDMASPAASCSGR